MTVFDLIKANPQRSAHPPESIFGAVDEKGDKRLLCMASFVSKPEMESILMDFPNLLQWVVIKEHFTQSELEQIDFPKKP